MDCDDASDSYASSDSQAHLVLEFNNQASLKNPDNFQTIDDDDISVTKLQVMEIENNWNEDESFLTPPSQDFPIPLPPPSGFDDFSSCITEEDPATFAGEIAALFSPTELQVEGIGGDAFDIGAEAGVCGLRNLGNTCFMSTGVQCLMATPALVNCFLEQNSSIKDSLIAHLSSLTQKMWSGQYSAVQPTDFKEILGVHFPQFKDFRQHDCQEFLALLLDGLHEQMNSAGNHKKVIEENKDCAKMDLNTGQESSTSYEQFESGACNIQKSQCNNVYTKHINGVSKSKLIEKNDLGLNTSDTQSDLEINFESVGSKSIHINNSIYGNKLMGLSNKTKLNSTADKEKEKSYPEGVLNNSAQRIKGLEDISKDSKTSNVNVLVTEQEANNEIRFDSEKYPRNDNVRRRETLNLNAFHIYENNTASGKRGKSTVTHYNCPSDFREGLDLKRLKLHPRESCVGDSGSGDEETLVECDQEKNQRMEEERKQRFPDSSSLLEKNYRMECERKRRELEERNSPCAGPSSACVENSNLELQNETREEESRDSTLSMELEAEKHWQKHLATHQSVIVDTFQGQFKSTVVCSGCKYKSVTYEPFMYLSVPLPHAMERQICVTFIGANNPVPLQYMLTVNKRDKVSCIKKQLLVLIGNPSVALILAEVLDNHVAKILDENYLVRYVDDTVRSLYAFEVISFQNDSCAGATSDEGKDLELSNNTGNFLTDSDACTICLEEMDSNMNRHVGCTCVLCDTCIARSSQHYGEGTLICPVCRMKLTPGVDLVAVQHTPNTKPSVRMLNIPLVFRLDMFGDGNNNMKTVKLFGHPRLLRLPNHVQSQELHEVVASLVPYSLPYKLLYVDGQGHHCSRCMFNSHCRGCSVPTEGSLMLHTGDTLAIMFSEPVEEITALRHSTMNLLRTQHPLSLYDCINAFSQSEVLDEHNPWYCPKCQQNQCATKTLSVWRYPNYLIVYLKRFVFHDCVSMKLEDKVMFPLCGLNLDSQSSLYDLYACVCHIGGVSAGHYTAYTQHLYTGEWHYFNDDYVTKQMPQEDDFSNAYILFYKMQGADVTNPVGNSSSRFVFPSHSHS